MLRKISIILLVLFVLGMIFTVLILQKRSDRKISTPPKPVNVYVVPFGIKEAGLGVPASGSASNAAGGGIPGSPPR